MTPASVTSLTRVPLLARGATVALVSPAGPLRGEADLAQALATAASLGWETRVGSHALARSAYFAGDDAQRAADLLAAIRDPAIDGIWCLRGGYGSARLLPHLSSALLQAHPKALIGYSDVTALHAAWQQAGLISFHGPTARSPLSEFSRRSFEQAIQQGTDSAGSLVDGDVIRGGQVTGRLTGGNLALVASLCGTPWAVNFRDAIVVLEDVNEAMYRVDRMLVQLHLAKAFEGCRAVMFGQFTDCPDVSEDGGRTLQSIAAELAASLHVPVVCNIPVGHVADQWTLPFGALATLDTRAMTLVVHHD